MAWIIYRHRVNPNIRYWVEISEKRTNKPKIYGIDEPDPKVRIKSVRNVRFDEYDFPPNQAYEAGMWPAQPFFQLYERDPNNPVYSPDTVISA